MTQTFATDTLPMAYDADGVIRVGGTRVTLDTVIASFQEGATAEEIIQQYPVLQLADVYHVIGYYLNHAEEIQSYLRHRQVQADEIRKMNESRFDPHGIRERLVARKTQTQS